MLIGGRGFDEELEPVEEQTTIGLDVNTGPEGSSLSAEFGVSHSQGDGTMTVFAPAGRFDLDIEGRALEGYVGARLTVPKGDFAAWIRPYIGGGVSVFNGDLEVAIGSSSASDDDTVLAGYVHGGVVLELLENLEIGVDARLLFGPDLDIAGSPVNPDYQQLALTFGYRF